jgi:hypothetical protein
MQRHPSIARLLHVRVFLGMVSTLFIAACHAENFQIHPFFPA